MAVWNGGCWPADRRQSAQLVKSAERSRQRRAEVGIEAGSAKGTVSLRQNAFHQHCPPKTMVVTPATRLSEFPHRQVHHKAGLTRVHVVI